MEQRPSLIQLAHTRKWVPKHESLGAARAIFHEYSGSWDMAEELASLSAALRSINPTKTARELLSSTAIERLVRRHYLKTQLAGCAINESQFTLKSEVAVNLVEPFVTASGVSAELVEPFVGREIIPGLFQGLQHEIHARRQKDLKASGLL